MDKTNYKLILDEISETVALIKENFENPHVLKFLTGKLHLLSKSLADTFNSN